MDSAVVAVEEALPEVVPAAEVVVAVVAEVPLEEEVLLGAAEVVPVERVSKHQ